jgi:hypothetical protein
MMDKVKFGTEKERKEKWGGERGYGIVLADPTRPKKRHKHKQARKRKLTNPLSSHTHTHTQRREAKKKGGGDAKLQRKARIISVCPESERVG